MSDQMREYLARVVPWPQEGEAPFHVGIHWTRRLPNRDKPVWNGRACRSIDEAVKAVQYALKQPDNLDFYCALGTQRQAETKTFAKGSILVPIRQQSNVVALKSLFIDIDFKGGPNGYNDQSEAIAALSKFLKDSGMPRPTMIVASGGGLHVYWTITRPLSPTEWQPLAYGLAEATKQLGLKCDTQCTIDSARVLRLPDTFNHKTSTPRPVRLAGSRLDFDYLPEKLKEILSPFAASAPSPLPLQPANAAVAAANAELSAGIEQKKAPPVPLDRLIEACPFIDAAITSAGKDLTNPLWNLTTLIAIFTEEGIDAAHYMASGHPGYTEQSTDDLYERKLREKEQKGLGWPSCRTISGTGAAQCATCPHAQAGKTPFHHIVTPAPQPAPLAQVQQQPDWDMPPGYARDAQNIVHRIVTNDDGTSERVPLLPYPLHSPWLQKNPWVLNFTTTSHHGNEHQVALQFSELLANGGTRAALGKYGIAVRGYKHAANVEEFFVAWIQKLQNIKDSVIQSAPFGWQNAKNGGTDGFAFGGQLWTPNGPQPCSAPDPVIGMKYNPVGERGPWHDACELVTSQGRPALDIIIASAFAAPLVKFTNQQGIAIACYSAASGIGKTTAMKVAQAVWGDPVSAMQGLDDTPLSVMNRIGHLRSLPLYWDELKTQRDTENFMRMLFTLTRGQEKSRLRQDATQRMAGSWQTMMISASNESIMDHILSASATSAATFLRTFEYEVPMPTGAGQIDTADADHIVGLLNNNYGQVGAEYSRWLGENTKQIAAEVLAERKILEAETSAVNNERFWMSTITVLLLGARYANQIGFTNFDEGAIKAFLLKVLDDMRALQTEMPSDLTKSDNVDAVLAKFLKEMAPRHTLWTNYIPVGAGKPSKLIKVVRDTTKLEEIYVHIGLESKLMRISSTYFTQWMHENKLVRGQFMRALEQSYGVKIVRGRMAAGTDRAVPANEHMIEVEFVSEIAKILEGDA